MTGGADSRELGRAPLLIAGGYGLVGTQAALLLRRRHPHLPLLLAGREPAGGRGLAARLGAATARLDVGDERPLASLPERPRAILATVADPADHLLADALRHGIPLADVDRGGTAAVLDVALRATRDHATAPVLLAGGWMGGTAALLAAPLLRVASASARVSLTVLASSGDRVGDGAWGFSRRWAWPYHVHERGRRRIAHPLTQLRRVCCPDGRKRVSARISTLEQMTLPLTLGVASVEGRLALQAEPELWGLVALKRSGALRALDHPRLGGVRRALLERSGEGDICGFTVSVTGGGPTRALDVLDPHGQAHLTGVGAALAAERVLGLAGAALPPGVSFPEQSACPTADVAALVAAGAVVHARGMRLADIAPAPGGEPLVPLDATHKERLST